MPETKFTLARDLWSRGFVHVGPFARQPITPEAMAEMRNASQALTAESFYVHPETGEQFACEEAFLRDKAKTWPVSVVPHEAACV